MGHREVNPDASIREHFRIGASRVYGRLLWQELWKLPAAKTYSGRALAERAGVDPSVPAKGRREGDLSFPYLVMLMAALDIAHPRELPAIPPKERLLVGGYQHALLYVRHVEWKKPYRTLEIEDVDCLKRSYRKEFLEASVAERKTLAHAIVESVGGRAIARARAAGGAYEYIRQLRETWTDAWAKAIDVIKANVGWTKVVPS